MDRWCTRAWIDFGLCITFIMTAFILIYWNVWSTELKIIAAVAALIPIHVVEEWVFPGGFHYQYNYCMRSDQLDRYPMCRKSDMYTNLIATFMYIGFTIYSLCNGGEVPAGIVVGTIGFCCLEVIIHTLNVARRMYLETKDKRYWWQMIQLLPSSYNQKRTVTFSYENAIQMIEQRSGHKLDEWNEFVDMLKHLPLMFILLNQKDGDRDE